MMLKSDYYKGFFIWLKIIIDEVIGYEREMNTHMVVAVHETK
jgi:hypothetical protein